MFGPIQSPLGRRRATRDLRRGQTAPDPGFAVVTACLLGVVVSAVLTGPSICPG